MIINQSIRNQLISNVHLKNDSSPFNLIWIIYTLFNVDVAYLDRNNRKYINIVSFTQTLLNKSENTIS